MTAPTLFSSFQDLGSDIELVVVSCQRQCEFSRWKLLHGFFLESLVEVSRRYGCLINQSVADLGRNDFSNPFRRTDFGDQAFVCLKVVCRVDIDVRIAQTVAPFSTSSMFKVVALLISGAESSSEQEKAGNRNAASKSWNKKFFFISSLFIS